MILKFNNTRSADTIQIAFKCVEAKSITQNSGVTLCNASSIDGINAVQPAAGTLKSIIGVASSTVASNGYGLAKAWGYQASVKLSNEGTSITITAGDMVIASLADLGFTSVGGGTYTAVARYISVGTTQAISAVAYASNCIVRMM
jgi:hypothetical protein